ncbi:3-hydroxybutyryl-CoA dehydratase [Usnea florida]
MYICDDWPEMPDGSPFDGKQLLTLVRSGNSPMSRVWDVNLLIRETEEVLGSEVIDIPTVNTGSNFYGFHFKLSNGSDIVARLARADVNMPDYDGFPMDWLISEAQFEEAVYNLLRPVSQIRVSHLLYHRLPVQYPSPRLHLPQDIMGRRLFLFQRGQGENNVWCDLSEEGKACLLAQSASIRASLFSFNPTLDFAATWLLKELFEQKPKSLPIPVAPTREFCTALFTSKIEATIKNVGDMIGWESDNNTVGPIAAAAKQSLLRFIPHTMPAGSEGDQSSFYRLVIEHGDFGIHNMSISTDADGQPLVTSLYDWETACIVPAILSDPRMSVIVDLVIDEDAVPSITRVDDGTTPDEHADIDLFNQTPDYETAIRAGRDARHLWFALRDWRGADPEAYFGELGAWAERRMKELGLY